MGREDHSEPTFENRNEVTVSNRGIWELGIWPLSPELLGVGGVAMGRGLPRLPAQEFHFLQPYIPHCLAGVEAAYP